MRLIREINIEVEDVQICRRTRLRSGHVSQKTIKTKIPLQIED